MISAPTFAVIFGLRCVSPMTVKLYASVASTAVMNVRGLLSKILPSAPVQTTR